MNGKRAIILSLITTCFVLLFNYHEEIGLFPETMRGDDEYVKKHCIKSSGEYLIYKTAANFSIKIPSWMSLLPIESHFTRRCELTSIKLGFAWVGGKLEAVPHPGRELPDGVRRPDLSETIVLMIDFYDPMMKREPYGLFLCKNKQPLYNYPEYNFRICPKFMPARKNPNIETLPFEPRFELTGDQKWTFNFWCTQNDLKGYTLKNIYDFEGKYACRGYWRWKDGVYIIFDTLGGKVIKEMYERVTQAEITLESLIVNTMQ
jgi:hypothetical protein